MDFTGKVVVVTGASSGIGATSSVLFAKHGARVVLVGRNEKRLNEVAAKCYQAKGVAPLCVQVDLLELGSCEAVVSRTIAEFGRIDVLVNSAGKMLLGSLFDETIDTFDELINLNLRIPYKLTHLALPHLIKTKGNVVNMAGTLYTRVRHGFLPYSISKAGLDRFTKSAAVELASEGVRMNSVQPGLTKTNILSNMAIGDDIKEYIFESLTRELPSYRLLEPEEVAKMVVFIASDVCPNINGADFSVHGGTAMM